MKRFYPFFIGFMLSGSLLMASTPTHAQQSDAMLELRPSATQMQMNESFYVDVLLKNPSAQNVISVRNWLRYDSNDLSVNSIERLDSPFTLAAPGENVAAPDENLIKMGYSNVSGGSVATEALVARVNFTVLKAEAKESSIAFYDYQVTELGHTSVNIISQGFPLNILAQAPKPLNLRLNGGAGPIEPDQVIPPPAAPPITTLLRPTNLRLNTTEGTVHLKWDKSTDINVSGYYLYYGKSSGLYTRRRAMGQVDSFILEGLTPGDTYYFSVTAHDAAGQESDYSNEAGVIVGQPLSSTHPFEALINKDLNNELLAQVPLHPENGPGMKWFLISTLGLGVVLGLGRRRPEKSLS